MAVITIGPAGEMLMPAAEVVNNDSEGNSSRYAGRGDLGAVMGSLKPIVVDGPTTFDAPVKESGMTHKGYKAFNESAQ